MTTKPAESAAPATPPAAGTETPPATPPNTETTTAPAKTEEPPARVVPENYDLKIPNGSRLDTSAVERVTAFAKERKLTNDEAQELLNREHEVIDRHVEGEKKKMDETVNSWIESSKTDKEIGGDNFKSSAESAKRVVERFGTPELKTALNTSGLGNHPEFVRLLARIGKAMTDDQLVIPGSQTGGSDKKAPEDVLYGGDKK